MMPIASAADLIKLNEGCRLQAYDDKTGLPVPAGGVAQGTLTIGYGHTGPDVTPGLVWSQARADAQFAADFATALRQASRDLDAGGDCWSRLDVCRQAVLIDMAYEIGGAGLAKFGLFLEAVRRGKWDDAAEALQDSRLFRQVPARELRNVAILLSGRWPEAAPMRVVPRSVALPPLAQPPAAIAAKPSLWARVVSVITGKS